MTSENSETVASVAAAIAGAAIGVAAGPGGIIVGAGLSQAAQLAIARVADSRRQRGEWVLRSAGTQAELEVDQLIDRLVASADGERLLVRAVLAAGNARVDERLMALARSLAQAVRSEDAEELGMIEAFVEILADLTDVQLRVLAAFTKTSTELGLGTDVEPMWSIRRATEPRAFLSRTPRAAKRLGHAGSYGQISTTCAMDTLFAAALVERKTRHSLKISSISPTLFVFRASSPVTSVESSAQPFEGKQRMHRV